LRNTAGMSVSCRQPEKADRLECEACNAIMWAGGPAIPSPGEPQAEPTIAKAINGGYDLLEAKCNRCKRVSLVALRALKHPPDTPVWKLEAALYCEPCQRRAELQSTAASAYPRANLRAARSRAAAIEQSKKPMTDPVKGTAAASR
jgi:hypothetical protein